SDGTVWAWGNDSKSQLCDGTTTNRLVPGRVQTPGSAKVARVAAGGHVTAMTTTDGGAMACGDNQSGLLGLEGQTIVARPTSLALQATKTPFFALNGAIAAWSGDGCAVRLAGSNDDAVVSTAATAPKGFVVRPNLSLCGPAATTTLPDIVNP